MQRKRLLINSGLYPILSIVILVLLFSLANSSSYAQKTMNKIWERANITPDGGSGRNDLKFSYDGKRVICIDGFTGFSKVNRVYVLDSDTGDTLGSVLYVTHSLAEGDADISYDGKYLAVTCPYKEYDNGIGYTYSPYIGIYETETFKLVDSIPLGDEAFNGSHVVRFSPDGKRIFSLTGSKTDAEYYPACSRLIVTDIETKEVLHNEVYPNAVYSKGNMLELTRDGKYYVVGPDVPLGILTDNAKFYVHDAVTYEKKDSIYVTEIDGIYTYFPNNMRISKDNKLYLGSYSETVRVYDLENNAKLISNCKHPEFNTLHPVLTTEGTYFMRSHYDAETTEFEPNTCAEKNKLVMGTLYHSHEDMYVYVWINTEMGMSGIGVCSYGYGDIKETIKPLVKVDLQAEHLRIDITLEQTSYLSIKLFDQSGKNLGLIKEGYFEGFQTIMYNIAHLSSGVYFVNVNGENHKFVLSK